MPEVEAVRSVYPEPMMVGVLSDTHVNDRGSRRLPHQVLDLFRRFDVGLILHAGDLNSLSVLDELERVAPALAVRGNSDLIETKRALPATREIEVCGQMILLVHGDAGPSANKTADGLAGRAGCIVYGHSHVPRLQLVKGSILFNPGSATDKRWWPDYSVGLLGVSAAGFAPELIVFRKPEDLDRITP
jgi:putative phosphoesterase